MRATEENRTRTLDMAELESKTVDELQDLAKGLEIAGAQKLNKHDLVLTLLKAQAEQNGFIFSEGVLEMLPEGYGFLRVRGYLPSPDDVYVSQSQIKRFGLKTGDTVSGQVRPPKDSERYFSLLRVEAVNGESPEALKHRVPFDALVAWILCGQAIPLRQGWVMIRSC